MGYEFVMRQKPDSDEIITDDYLEHAQKTDGNKQYYYTGKCRAYTTQQGINRVSMSFMSKQGKGFELIIDVKPNDPNETINSIRLKAEQFLRLYHKDEFFNNQIPNNQIWKACEDALKQLKRDQQHAGYYSPNLLGHSATYLEHANTEFAQANYIFNNIDIPGNRTYYNPNHMITVYFRLNRTVPSIDGRGNVSNGMFYVRISFSDAKVLSVADVKKRLNDLVSQVTKDNPYLQKYGMPSNDQMNAATYAVKDLVKGMKEFDSSDNGKHDSLKHSDNLDIIDVSDTLKHGVPISQIRRSYVYTKAEMNYNGYTMGSRKVPYVKVWFKTTEKPMYSDLTPDPYYAIIDVEHIPLNGNRAAAIKTELKRYFNQYDQLISDSELNKATYGALEAVNPIMNDRASDATHRPQHAGYYSPNLRLRHSYDIIYSGDELYYHGI